MRYHKYKNKPGGYYVKRNRLGGFSTIQEKNMAVPGCSGCSGCGCLLSCLFCIVIIGLQFS